MCMFLRDHCLCMYVCVCSHADMLVRVCVHVLRIPCNQHFIDEFSAATDCILLFGCSK